MRHAWRRLAILVAMPKAAAQRAVMVATACVAFASLAATRAGAAPAWLAPVNLSAAGLDTSAANPEVALDAQGNAVAVWERYDGKDKIVQSAVRPAGSGAWQAPVNLSEPGGNARSPMIAVDPQGDAVAVWERTNVEEEKEEEAVVQGAVRPAGSGAWGPPVNLSATGPKHRAANPRVVLDPQGNAVAVWERSSGENYIVQSAIRQSGSTTWQPAVDLSESGPELKSPMVAVDPQGNAVAVWERFNKETKEKIIQSSVRPAGSGAWQAPTDISKTGGSAREPQIALDPQGNAVAVWERDNSEKETLVQGAVRPAGTGIWQTPTDLAKGEGFARSPMVGLDSQGNAVVVWEFLNTTSTEGNVLGAVRPAATGVWQPPIEVSVPGHKAANPQIALDPQGNAVTVWEQEEGPKWIVEAAARPAVSGIWQAPAGISSADLTFPTPQVAVDPQGNVVAVWERPDSEEHRNAQAAAYDAAGPFLNARTIPTTGVAGQPVAFSVSPLDVWSALGATNWSFGDGAGTNGTSVTHSYANVGSYPVTVTGADVLGNTTSASGVIAIAAAPSPPPSPPMLTAASLTNKRFRVARQSTAISAKKPRKAPLGTSFRFTLSAAARLEISITRSAQGLRRGRSCLAPSAKLRRKHAQHCTRTLTVGTLTRSNEPKGTDSIAFSGRIGHRALSPQTYKALLSASNASGRSKPVILTFAVVR